MMHRLSEAGDTIMEVLISMAVLGLILASSFTLANRSTYANRSAGERGQASKIAEQQIELLKIYMTSGTAVVPNDGNVFCLSVGAGGVINYHPFAANPDPDPNKNPAFLSTGYPTECANYNGIFNFYILRGGLGNTYSGDTFRAVVRWESPNGKNINESSLIGRVYASNLGLGT